MVKSLFHYSTTPLLLALALISCQRAGSTQPPEAKIWSEFSGEKALAYVRYFVDLGPRPPGSEALEKSRAYIEEQLHRAGWKVERQEFADDTPRGKVRFVNLIA